MTEYFPKSEQIDTLNGKLDALNETLKKREDFVSAVAKMEAATTAANSAASTANTAATNANTAAAGVVSPTVTTSKADGVTTVTITDKDGAHTATIEDGAKGDTGAEALRATKNYAATYTTIGCDASWSTDFFNRMPVVGDIFTNIDASSNTGTWKITSVSGGLAHFTLLSYVSSKGADGFSPTATVTKSGTTTTVTVTDKTGTTTAEVKDGSDATVTKDNIVSALGYEPVKPEGNYELIEEITLTEDTTVVTLSDSLAGYNYLNIFVHSPSTAKWKTVQCDTWDSSGAKYYWFLTGLLNVNGVSCVNVGFANGMITMILFSGISGNQAVDGGNCRFCKRVTSGKYLTKIKLYISSTEAIPADTVFKIYGIRA